MTRTIAWIAVAAALALGGCNKKSQDPPSTGTLAGSGSAMAAGSGGAMAAGSGSAMAAGSGSSAGSATAAGSGSAATAQVDVPTEMDFEQDATAKITDKNVEAQVQSIEKELEQK
jgi:hypothetical protein